MNQNFSQESYPSKQTTGDYQHIHDTTQAAFYDFAYSDSFAESLVDAGVNEDEQFSCQKYWELFSIEIDNWLSSTQYDDKEKSVIRTLAKLPILLIFDITIDNVTKREKSFLSDANAALRQLIRHNPDATIENVLRNSSTFLRNQLTDVLSKNELAMIDRALLSRIKGVRSECAFEQIMDELNIEYYESGIDDDLEGVDYVVQMNDGAQLDVDVKKSTDKLVAQAVKDGQQLHGLFYMKQIGHKKKVLLVPYVSEKSGYQIINGEHSFLIKPEALSDAAEQMNTDIFHSAQRIA